MSARSPGSTTLTRPFTRVVASMPGMRNSNPTFGVDGTVIWLTYSQQRTPGGDQDYGGLSLGGFFLGEKLFIGSPGGTNEMGVDSSFCCGGPLASIPGTDADTLYEIVVKVEFLPGDEAISMWLDPAVPHPTTTPDLATTAPDFFFNEIRLQSGSGGGQGGFEFDSILFEIEEASMAEDFCNGDGGDQLGCTNCPCGNNAPMGTIGGCINQSGNSAQLVASGSFSVAAADPGDLRFEMTGGNPSTLAVLTSGDNLAPQNMANPCFGTGNGVQSLVLDGLRCAVGNTQRHGGRPMDANGDVGITNNAWGGANGPAPSIAAQGGFVAGQSRYFQVFYRADDTQGCLTGQNTTQAVSITFQP